MTCPPTFPQNIVPVKQSANYVQGPLLTLPPLKLWSLFFIHIFSLLERRGKGRRGEEWEGEGRRGEERGGEGRREEERGGEGREREKMRGKESEEKVDRRGEVKGEESG